MTGMHSNIRVGCGRRRAAVFSLAVVGLTRCSHAFSPLCNGGARARASSITALSASSAVVVPSGEFGDGIGGNSIESSSRGKVGGGKPRRQPSRRKARTTTALDASASSAVSTKRGGGVGIARKLIQKRKKRTAAAAAGGVTSPKSPSFSETSVRPRNIWISRSEVSGARIQRIELVDHDLLTKEEDLALGAQVARATKLRSALTDLVEEKRLALLNEQKELKRYLEDVSSDWSSIYDYSENDDDDDDDDDMYVNEYSSQGRSLMRADMYEDDEDSDEDDFLEGNGFSVLEREHAAASQAAHNYVLVDEGSRLNASPIEADLRILTDEEIMDRLHLAGGRKELRSILRAGADARETLMKCNMRLVVNISKKWIKRSNKDGVGLSSLYLGGWDKPSLDEIIQEGFIGLARAVDKYDASRGLRFSTYATHWITSYVRQTFQRAVTGCLRVPSQLHDIKMSYKKLVRQYYDESRPIPSGDVIAAELGVTRNRLETALRVTESLMSVDQPLMTMEARRKGSAAGGDHGDTELTISDILKCREPMPEELVELSLLRQCLENAMAAELSPHERDILRLRLGLDDGQSRTVREVVEVCGGGVRPADVRSAERRAFKKLRTPGSLQAHRLNEYMHMAGLSSADIDLYKKR